MNEPDFILICISSILGFLFKYLFDIIFSYYRKSFEENYDKEHKSGINDNVSDSDSDIIDFEKNIKIFEHDKFLFYFIFLIYGGSIVLSVILYKFLFKECSYENYYNENNEKKIQNKLKNVIFLDISFFYKNMKIRKIIMRIIVLMIIVRILIMNMDMLLK